MRARNEFLNESLPSFVTNNPSSTGQKDYDRAFSLPSTARPPSLLGIERVHVHNITIERTVASFRNGGVKEPVVRAYDEAREKHYCESDKAKEHSPCLQSNHSRAHEPDEF